MEQAKLTDILERVSTNRLSVEEAMAALKNWPTEMLDYAHLDHHRQLRTGRPEVIFGQDKSSEQVIGIMERMLAQSTVVVATRIDPIKAEAVCARLGQVRYEPEARMLIGNEECIPDNVGRGTIMVVSAGTSDQKVAEEAYETVRLLGHKVEKRYDTGVAGIHRLFSCLDRLREAKVIIVVAGMEGALPSVIAGLVECPVVAVPTSIGYGAGFGGIAALLGMLNSCAPGIAVVNIDNGFGAGCMAAAINRKDEERKAK